jgi:hypothetical protein
MNASTWTKPIITTAVAATLIGATVVPAEAKTDDLGGDTTAAYGGRIYQIDELVAMQKERMSRDYVRYAAARARLAASQAGSELRPEPPRTNRWGVGGSEL